MMNDCICRFSFLASLVTLVTIVPARAQTKTLKAEVWDVRGPATLSISGGTPRAVESGTVIPAGAVIKTGVGAVLDISFGKNVGFVRLPQSTVLNVNKLDVGDAKNAGSFDIQFALPEGTLLGDVRELSEAGKFEVRTTAGLVGVRGGKFRIQSEGYVVLLSGTVFNVNIPSSGDPVLHKLNGPPAVYFSPVEGVRPAPPGLVQEVQGQLQTRLRSP